ncbi:MAG: 30S ribosomal protein S2 [Candidatus Vogelbacteria bacterium CG10_big_fil_rev_8_21_14_0_10_51_16]|uniref:Small ribosomal subunit protein uS2 n=1 Tax=Candidatus Vogelbacteria bacterium CG10_big_fil_rev_8_21_14_0_10_51_16 TaxID=1975045 RepID=A0A2H0RGS7_9BACT|nr:MAG: 30S ribosomal protein S2 [Candidatus Vogelbacteria bacterium CG10_big_fil_rev_8_21_14_0_10_51_16]
MDATTLEKDNKIIVQELSETGAQYGFSRSRRHPTTGPFIYAVKNRVEIIDLEKSADLLIKACAFVRSVAEKREQILFSGNKLEARDAVYSVAERLEQPHAKERWLGGTITNWSELKKRVGRLVDLTQKREAGELGKYTKKERVVIDREIAHLERFFGGLLAMKQVPGALFVVDPREEHTAVAEARALKIPVVALAGTDCDVSLIDYPILANDTSRKTITYVLSAIADAYKSGLEATPKGSAGIITPEGVATLAGEPSAEEPSGAEFGI